jgi:hypothetical protein
MTFEQSDKMLGALKMQVAGPAWASIDPTGPQATALISKLSPGPLTINVAWTSPALPAHWRNSAATKRRPEDKGRRSGPLCRGRTRSSHQ